MRLTFLSFSMLMGILALTGCGHKEPKARQMELDQLPRLETVKPKVATLPVRIELSATVEPLQRADLCARVPGIVESLPADVDIGKQVKTGDELIRLAVPELQAQKKHKEALLEQSQRTVTLGREACKVAEAEGQESEKQEKRYAADYLFSKQQYERVLDLFKRGATQQERVQETQRQMESASAAWEASKAVIETKKARLESSKADLLVAQSKVDVARAEVKNLEEMIGLATIRAPFDGIITKRWVDRGAAIKDAGAPLLTVMQTDVVRVLVDVPERHVSLVRMPGLNSSADEKGNLVDVNIPALKDTETHGKFTCNITRIGNAIDPATRTMRTEIHLDNKHGLLRPGMYGSARILLAERPDALTIPSSALVRRGEDMEVYYVADLNGTPERGRVRRAKVDLGLDDGKRVEILKGLTVNDLVIAKGNGVVREGDTVVPVAKEERE